MKSTSDQTTEAQTIVRALLNEEDLTPEDFMRNIAFGPKGEVFPIEDLEWIRKEQEEFSQKVINLLGQAMPELVKRGIVEPRQASIVAKVITHELADREYNPKHWTATWMPKARKIKNYITSHLSWR